MSETAPSAGLTLEALRGQPRRMRRETAVRRLFLGAAALSIVISSLIIISLAKEAFTFISRVDLGALWTDGWFPRRDMYDIKTIFVGSVLVTLIAMVVAAP